MSAFPLPSNEHERLEELLSLDVLDSPREPEFDEISELAAQVCDTPIALVTLLDAERQWFKSRLGIDQEEIPREHSFCAYAIAEEQKAFVVPDARADPRFNQLPLVTDDPYVRFYAGIPLEMKSGHNLGTLCVLDSEPRDLTEHQRRALRALAHQVTALLELRRYRRELLHQLNAADHPEDALSSTWDSISQLARRIRQVFWLEDPEAGEIVYLSPSFDLLWGRSRADFTGKPPSALLEAVHPHDRARVVERKGPEPIDYRIQRRDGRVRWINHESFELVTAGGARRVASLAEDVTDRVTAETALHVSEQRFRQMLEHLDDAVCVAEPETLRPVFVNRAYERIWGRSAESLYERSDSWTDAIHPDDRWRLDAGLERWADTARFDQELRILRPDGELRWVRARAFPIVGEDGEWLLLAGMGEDVTEQKTARAERGRLEETLGQAQKLEVVGRLAGGVAHDFNNLLAIIAGSASILDERCEPDELRTETREILDATDRAAKLVTQLLAVSRPRTPATASTDLTQLARGTEGLLRRTLGEHIRIALDLDPATPPARLDRSHAEQVLLNLAVNARDAMPGGGVLSISVSPSDDRVRLAVSDSGIGIPEELRDRIFEPFFTTKAASGTGLGLSTVQRIVRSAGGDIELHSRPGGGTSFELLLPVATAAPAAPGDLAGVGEPEHGTGTILVVEDEAPLRRVIARTLERAGYRVLAPETALAARDQIRGDSAGFDLLLTDLVMPDLSGEELARELATVSPDTPTVFMSGYAPGGSPSARPGEDSVIAKPFRPDELLAQIRVAFSRAA